MGFFISSHKNGPTVLYLRGASPLTATEFSDAVEKVLGLNPSAVVIHMGEVSAIDLSLTKILALSAQEVRRSCKIFRVSGLGPALKELLIKEKIFDPTEMRDSLQDAITEVARLTRG